MGMIVEVKNLPDYPLRTWVVARYDSGKLWFYGTYDEYERAENVARTIGNGLVVKNGIV